jgi:hypothetical protein
LADRISAAKACRNRQVNARGQPRKRTRNGIRQQAIALGLNKYLSDKPCAKGHLGYRQTYNSSCIQCIVENTRRKRSTPEWKIQEKQRLELKAVNEPWVRLYNGAKARSRERELEINIDPAYVKSIWPPDSRCPVFGFKLTTSKRKPGPDSATLDRIDPRMGYVRGNVVVISFKANQIKSSAINPQEIYAVASWLASVSSMGR